MADDASATEPVPDDGGAESSRGVYGIGVTSDLVGTAIQNLRAYERAGLIQPSRTSGGNRLYSPDDVARLRRIQVLLAQGLNLAGVAQVLDLQDANARLRVELSTMVSATDPPPGPDDVSGASPSRPTPEARLPGSPRRKGRGVDGR
jgi:DNA-binding transcriptional MerR regulator